MLGKEEGQSVTGAGVSEREQQSNPVSRSQLGGWRHHFLTRRTRGGGAGLGQLWGLFGEICGASNRNVSISLLVLFSNFSLL